MGFVKSDTDLNLYYLIVESEPLILVLYVDDLFLASSSRLIEYCKKNLATKFDMKDMGRMHYFLGLKIWQQKGEIFLGQGRYSTEILKSQYQARYLLRCQHPQSVHGGTKEGSLSNNQACSQVFIGSSGLLYNKGKDTRLSGFTDADWVGSSVDRKSTSGYCFNIGSGITSWCSRKQKFVALSSSEAEYMVASTTSCEAIWRRKLLVNLFKRNMEATMIICDNQSCIKLSENLVFHDMSKHIYIWCHFVRDCVQHGAVQLSYTPTGEKAADILTKALGKSKFDYFREKMGMLKNPF
eukprot:PITA_26091